MQQDKAESVVENLLAKAGLDRSSLVTALSVLALSIFIIFLFLINKADWEQKLAQAGGGQPGSEGVEAQIRQISTELQKLKTSDSLRTRFFYDNLFDPRVKNDFRMYGLYKDRSNSLSTAEVARKFGISNEKAVKLSEADGERWFIVPVKGLHFVQAGDTAEGIARKYYPGRSRARLILDFNGPLKAGAVIFLPFD